LITVLSTTKLSWIAREHGSKIKKRPEVSML
jgi:hypothetical protein